MTTYRSVFTLRLAAAGMALPAALALPGVAAAQGRTITLPAMPLGDALQRIAASSGATVRIDPDAVKGQTSRPVAAAQTARDAIRQATRGLPVAVEFDGTTITIANGIVVTARRDEAETSVLVRGATSSSRLGESLRDQPRNTQVISARLLAEQQVQTLSEALANAGGVVVNSATVQGGVGYSVRGFSSNGSVNGLPTSSNSTFAAGVTQPLANIERIEVLKGPDAILLGGDNLGGTINIVSKKPSAEERLYVSAETGSFGLVRGTVDANRALSPDDRLSARVIATAATASRNAGDYRGNEDYLFAPSLRYKNGVTDIILSATLGNQIFGMVPYTLINPATLRPYDTPADRRLLGPENQYIQIGTTQFNAEATQKLTDWATVVVRGQHQEMTLALSQYSPFAVLNAGGTILLSASGTRQKGNTDVLDTYARFQFDTGPLRHKIVAGYTHVDGAVSALSASNGGMFTYNFLAPTAPLRPLATTFAPSFSTTNTQDGYYGQYLLHLWRIDLLAGVRHNKTRVDTAVVNQTPSSVDSSATTPNFGAVMTVTDTLSVFGTLAYGFIPTLTPDRFGNRLPDVRSRNTEAGIKWDLFDKRMLINASWFSIRQSNLLITDPAAPRFQMAVPGQRGRGIDVNVSGEPVPGLSLTGSYTRTDYDYLTPSATLGNVVFAQPRDVYNAYGSYRRPLSETVTAGLGAGVTGRSRSSINRLGTISIPAAVQANLNAFLTVGRLDLNVGVRNLFDRQNYGTTSATSYVPLGEPRSWRLTAGYRFR